MFYELSFKTHLNQKKLLAVLSFRPIEKMYGELVRKSTKLTPSSIDRALHSLEKADVIYRNASHEYCILDPALAHFIKIKSYFNIPD